MFNKINKPSRRREIEMGELEEKVGQVVLDELKKLFNPKEIPHRLFDRLEQEYLSHMGMNMRHPGNVILSIIKTEFVKKFIENNYEQLSKKVDMKAVENMLTMEITKEFARNFSK